MRYPYIAALAVALAALACLDPWGLGGFLVVASLVVCAAGAGCEVAADASARRQRVRRWPGL